MNWYEEQKLKLQEIADNKSIERRANKRKKEILQVEKQYQEYKIINEKNKEEWGKQKIEFIKSVPKISNQKRYQILRKVFYGKAYISDDVLWVDDYMNDYILNPLFSIESSMYEYYLHSIYDIEKGGYINAITL